jgi:hypothetical protein
MELSTTLCRLGNWVPELSPCLSYSITNSLAALHTSQITKAHVNYS